MNHGARMPKHGLLAAPPSPGSIWRVMQIHPHEGTFPPSMTPQVEVLGWLVNEVRCEIKQERHFPVYMTMKTSPSSSKGERSPGQVVPQGGLYGARWLLLVNYWTNRSPKEHRHQFKSWCSLSLTVWPRESYLLLWVSVATVVKWC